jgi:hypothetical protein
MVAGGHLPGGRAGGRRLVLPLVDDQRAVQIDPNPVVGGLPLPRLLSMVVSQRTGAGVPVSVRLAK